MQAAEFCNWRMGSPHHETCLMMRRKQVLVKVLQKLRHLVQCAPEAPPQAGLEHAVRPEVVIEDARRARVRQDVRVALHVKPEIEPRHS